MVKIADLSGIPDNPPAFVTLGQENFSRGVISLVNESKLPRNAVTKADNATLAEDGALTERPGVNWYGETVSANQIDGAFMHVTTDDVSHIVVVSGGKVRRSVDDGETWEVCHRADLSENLFTAGKKVSSEQVAGYTYVYNGWDVIARYDGTLVLDTYDPIAMPVLNTPTLTGIAGSSYNLRYRVSAVNDIGFTQASVAQVVGSTTMRQDFSDTKYVTLTWAAIPGAKRYDIFFGQSVDEEVYIDSVENATTYVDKGRALEQVGIVAPSGNTTQGPRVGDMAMVGDRLYGTADRDYPHRIWMSGAGNFIGMFSSAYDATYLDWQPGGQLKPIKVEDYRDGKGTPLATIWCKSKDGRGAVLQGYVESVAAGTINVPVPNFYQLPGSRGTNAPFSVVNVLNDYMYYNLHAIYNLGSRAQFLNLLSTDESSANIRPDMKRIRESAAPGIAAHFQDAKVYFSVPYDSDVNSATIIFDTERKAWLPRGFTIGFERFFSYTDNGGVIRTLCWKPGDTRLSEISEDIKGDYGMPFFIEIVTGLNHVNPKNRFDFLFVEEAEFEFAEPEGTFTVELSGYTREDGFRKIDQKTIEPEQEQISWGLYKWTDKKWGFKGTDISTFSERSLKRFFTVQEEINAWQYRIFSEDIHTKFILRTLQINGTATEAGKPSEWELFE